ncbi:MAG TPA: RNA 2',3'-cyclic phosphodiesterase [Candidatus Altiarchaeales archaeon]|nr:RNA 2',3'-cyclic phosphodiesterase [Candidatus Altiarchaeales archaeon]
MRCFIAIECPRDLREKLCAVQNDVNGFGDMNLVEMENMHLTLKFLGEIPEEKIEKTAETLKSIDSPGFELELRGVGVFPKPASPRVFWAGCGNGSGEVKDLQKNIDSKLEKLGFEKDARFHPHFTLSRIKSIRDKTKIFEYLEENKNTLYGNFKAENFVLMKSTLTPKGAVYYKIREFTLR